MALSKLGVGTIQTLAAYLLWGLLPLFWRGLSSLPSSLVLAHRIVGALVVTTILVGLTHQGAAIRKVLRHPRQALAMAGAALLISANWWLYIWAIATGRVVESALGYYMNPVLSIVLGVVFLRERMSLLQVVAVAVAGVGVVVMAMGVGGVPLVALGLALTFGFYGLLKKQAPLESLPGLQVETLFSLPFAVLLALTAGSPSLFGDPHPTTLTVVLLILAGPVTALPLWLFGAGARKIPLVRLGFLQYLSPTLTLLLGLTVFSEPFGPWRMAAFGCVALAVILVLIDAARRSSARVRQSAVDAG